LGHFGLRHKDRAQAFLRDQCWIGSGIFLTLPAGEHWTDS